MDSSPSATRQPKQARAIRTRERILDRAEHAFATKGYEAASLTSDILEPARISVGSFYHQFSDKRAVLYELLDERSAWRDVSASATLVAGSQATLADAIRAAMLRFFDDIDEHPAMWWIHVREINNSDLEIRRHVEHSWTALIDTVRAVLESRLRESFAAQPGRVTFAVSGLSGILHLYLAGDDSTRRRVRRELLDHVVAACVDSFGP